MSEDQKYECPLCATDFTGAECHSACPMSRGCAMVRCPHCGYEFVESGRIVDMLRRWIRRAPPVKAAGPVPITDLPIGASAPITHIANASAARLNRLASYGIVAGTEVRLIATRPSVVLGCGPTVIALDDEIASEIYVSGPQAPFAVNG